MLDGVVPLEGTHLAAALENYSGISFPIPRADGDQVRLQVPKFKRESIRRSHLDQGFGGSRPYLDRGLHICKLH